MGGPVIGSRLPMGTCMLSPKNNSNNSNNYCRTVIAGFFNYDCRTILAKYLLPNYYWRILAPNSNDYQIIVAPKQRSKSRFRITYSELFRIIAMLLHTWRRTWINPLPWVYPCVGTSLGCSSTF